MDKSFPSYLCHSVGGGIWPYTDWFPCKGVRHPHGQSPTPNSICISNGGAGGVMVIVVGNGHGDTSSNSRRDWLHFT